MFLISVLLMSKSVVFFALFVIFLIDLYVFQSFKTVTKNKFILFSYWIFSVFYYCCLIYNVMVFSKQGNYMLKLQFIIGFSVLYFVSKLFILIPILLEDIFRIISFIFSKFNNQKTQFPERRKFISTFALLTASIPFSGILYGILKGKYNYKVLKNKLFFKDLPKNFDGFKILQISDLHVGSFTNKQKIIETIDFINQQKADLIVITGDFVNLIAEEFIPYKEIFGKLKSPNGIISILGNHDYGNYAYGNDELKVKKNKDLLIEYNKELNFKLLLNNSLRIYKDSEFINIIGVENWGKKPFPQYGDLEKATKKIEKNEFNVLLSHDPTHFDEKVKHFNKNIHLTLSGHTHGMQFGIEIPKFFKFSPVQFIYPKWAGLYQENGKYLYVNRGFGYNAFPARVGIWPEITIIELKSE